MTSIEITDSVIRDEIVEFINMAINKAQVHQITSLGRWKQIIIQSHWPFYPCLNPLNRHVE